MNLPILIWISGAGIPAGHPNLLPGQRILFKLMAQRTLWQVLHSMRKWTDLLFASRRRVFFLSFFLSEVFSSYWFVPFTHSSYPRLESKFLAKNRSILHFGAGEQHFTLALAIQNSLQRNIILLIKTFYKVKLCPRFNGTCPWTSEGRDCFLKAHVVQFFAAEYQYQL